MEQKPKQKTNTVTTVTFLDRNQVDFLDRLSKDYFFKYGHKLPRTKILSQLVTFLMKANITIGDLNLEDQNLADGIIECLADEFGADANEETNET